MSPPVERWAEGPHVLASVWHYRWLVLSSALVLGLAGYLGSQAQDEVYEAETVMYLANPETSGVFGQAGRTNLDRYLPQQAERATSTPVLSAAADRLDDGSTPASLRSQVDVTADIELTMVEVTARAGSSAQSAAIANAVATAYQESVQTAQLERAARATSELDRAAGDLEEQIAELESVAVGDADETGASVDGQLGVLSQRLSEIDALRQQLAVDARLFGSGVEFVEEAEPPAAPIAPRPRVTAIALTVLGALLASALAYWMAGRSQKVASRDDPGRVLGVPLLGVLPTYSPADRGTLRERTRLDSRTAEAYRFVHSSLDAILREIGATSVMITSASPSTGKTETALQVASTAHRRGQEVLLIDADLRMRGLTTFLRAERSSGLRDLADRPRGAATALVSRYPIGDHRELSVLTAGYVATDGNEQLNETWFGPAFAELTNGHDLTVVDSPPLLAVADTAMIAGYTDAIVLVVREGSDLDELDRVRQRLQFVGQRLVGYIYLSPNALDDTAFDYGLVRATAWESLGTSRRPKADPRATPPEATHDEDQRHRGPVVPVHTGESVSLQGPLAESDPYPGTSSAHSPRKGDGSVGTQRSAADSEDPETRDRRN